MLLSMVKELRSWEDPSDVLKTLSRFFTFNTSLSVGSGECDTHSSTHAVLL